MHPDLQNHPNLFSREASLDSIFSSTLDESSFQSMLSLLASVQSDSKVLLTIEQNIKQHIENPQEKNVFLMLAAIFVRAGDAQVQQVAAIILRNSLQTYYGQIHSNFPDELKLIEKVLYILIESEGLGKKSYTELLLIISKLCQKRFNSDEGDNDLLLSLFASFEDHFNPQTLDVLIQIFETIDDDRMSRFVPYLLSYSINYLPNGSNKLLYFIQILYKNLEWAINVDPEVISKAVIDSETIKLISTLVQHNFTHLKCEGNSENPLTKFNYQFIEEKRLSAKILTILSRDHQAVSKSFKSGNKDAFNEIFRLCIQNLVFFYPVFLYFINTVSKELFDDMPQTIFYSGSPTDEIDFEQYDQEIKAYVAQLIQLIQTMMNLCPKQVQKEMYLQFVNLIAADHQIQQSSNQLREILKQILQLMLGYCSLSKFDFEMLTGKGNDNLEAQNSFLITFLETEEDQFNMVSIRLSITEFIEEIGIIDDSYCDKLGLQNDQNDEILLSIIRNLYQGSQSLTTCDPQRVQQMLQNYTSVNQIDIMKDLFLSVGNDNLQNIQLQEIALFIMGIFRENILIQTPENMAFVEKLVFNDLLDENTHGLIAMRILWLMEKLSYHDQFFRGEDRDFKLKQIFEKLVDLFITQQSQVWTLFPIRYQCLRSLYRFTKKINLKKTYPDNSVQILCEIFKQINSLLPFCTEETIDVPIQAISYFSKIDFEASRAFGNDPDTNFMANIMVLYNKFHQDGLLGDDIVDLIRIQSSIPGNLQFKSSFLPLIKKTIEIFYNCVMNLSSKFYQEEAQKIIDSNQLKSMLAILNSYILRNPDVKGDLSQEEQNFYTEIFKMICEILNSYKDTYVNMHCVLTLAAFLKLGSRFQELIPSVKILMNKLTNCNVGLDESSSLYMGHAILNLLQLDLDEGLLFHCMMRVIKCDLPSALKSYSLPLSYIFSAKQGDLLPQLIMLMIQNEGKPQLLLFLDKLVKNFLHQMESSGYTGNIDQDLALKIQALGLAGLLEFTAQDIEFAALMIGQEKLQNVLVMAVSEYVAKIQKKASKEEKKMGENDGEEDMYGDEGMDDPYGPEFGDYGDYGMEDFGEMGDQPDENLDADMAAQNSTKKEEQNLLESILQGTEPISKIEGSLRLVGQQSIQKIISATEDLPESRKFSEGQKEILYSLF